MKNKIMELNIQYHGIFYALIYNNFFINYYFHRSLGKLPTNNLILRNIYFKKPIQNFERRFVLNNYLVF